MKKADLTPPLGLGGPCGVVQRIRGEVDNVLVRDRLEDAVEVGRDLSNDQAAAVYDLEAEPGVGPVKSLMLGPHAQYRMDLRGVTVDDVRRALAAFYKNLNDLKSRKDWEYASLAGDLGRGDVIQWLDPKTKLFTAFRMEGAFTVKLVTTYWKGRPDPRAPGIDGCDRVANTILDFRRNPPTPRVPEGFSTSYNAPASDGQNHDVRQVPGEQYGHPWQDDIGGVIHVATDDVVADDVVADTFRLKPRKRQHRRRPADRLKARRWYQRNRARIKARARIRFKRVHRMPGFKKQRHMRQQHPEWFKRLPRAAGQARPTFVLPETMRRGHVHAVDEDGVVMVHLAGDDRLRRVGLGYLMRVAAFLGDKNIDAIMDMADRALGGQDDLGGVPSPVRVAARIADIEARLDPDVARAAGTCRPQLARVDKRAATWTFRVPSATAGKPPYQVRVKAVARGNAKAAGAADVWVSCTCPFWRWQGPEHWAKQGDYLLGKPAGTAARPSVRDPDGRKVACKHAVAALRAVSRYDVLEAKVQRMATRVAAAWIGRVPEPEQAQPE